MLLFKSGVVEGKHSQTLKCISYADLSLCVLPGGSGDKISIQQPQFAEQNTVDKRNSRQFLQGQMGLELEFLLFHEKCHLSALFALIKHN